MSEHSALDSQTSFEKNADAVAWVLLSSAAVAVCAAFYLNYFTLQYEYIVEAACDPDAEECYFRDCEKEECPPNGLDAYTIFSLPAERFRECSDNSCTNLCLSESSPCTQIPCSSQEEIECILPEAD